MNAGIDTPMTLVNFVNKLYLYFKLSVLFWFYLARGLVVLSLFPALVALLETADILRTGDEDQVGQIFRASYKKSDEYKRKSFGFVFMLSALAASILATRLETVSVSPLITGFLVYLAVMETVILVYSAWFITKDQMPFKRILIKSFIVSVRKLPVTVSLIVLTCFAGWVCAWNLVLMVFCVPGIWAFFVREIIQITFYSPGKSPKKRG